MLLGALSKFAGRGASRPAAAEAVARAGAYEASDRKYHSARAMANRDLKADYAKRVSR
jgi:hypothetical protein